MELREGSLLFERTVGSGPKKGSAKITFPRKVEDATVVMAGYTASFEDDDRGHEFERLTAELSCRVRNRRVDVSGTFGLRDASGNWDDPYSGVINFIVLARLEPAVAPAPGEARGDLQITGAEITQAIQHFRSAQHLDLANVFPDNSIRLVESKPTAVRLYIDYDAASGLAPIESLSGVLTVTSGSTPREIVPLQAIEPRRDSSIARGRIDHTLNFIIPEDLCEGEIEIEAHAFDERNPTQLSRSFSRSLTFVSRPVLPIMAVAIEYTGPDVDDAEALAAPDEDDFVALFDFAEAVFPVPSIEITSLVEMTYAGEMKSDISQGCDKLWALKDKVAELKGDSDDIVYGLYNTGVDTGTVGGCGDNGTAVGPVGQKPNAAHEIGHALGRPHAPCDNVSRCGDPRWPDAAFPRFAGYDSDSIGEFGFDTRPGKGKVIDPAVGHDFMGYSKDSEWISPYTYKALMSSIPEQFGQGGAFFSFAGRIPRRDGDPRGCWIPLKQPMLFLRVDIHRDRKIDLLTSFHFPARPRQHGSGKTDFLIELQDEKGAMVGQHCLFSDESCCAGCGCGGSWPLRIRQAIAFNPLARSLVLYECEKEMARWPISLPPKVRIEVQGSNDRERDEVALRWGATRPEGALADGLWYLVQWRDRSETWRGLAPRTQDTRLTVPKRIFAGERRSFIRVLASAGVATGEAAWQGEILQPGKRRSPKVAIGLVGAASSGAGTTFLPARLKAALETASGASAPARGLRWYDSNGGELGRGRTLNLAGLPVGRHQITAKAADSGMGDGTASWLVDHLADGRFVLLGGSPIRPERKKTRQPAPKEK